MPRAALTPAQVMAQGWILRFKRALLQQNFAQHFRCAAHETTLSMRGTFGTKSEFIVSETVVSTMQSIFST